MNIKRAKEEVKHAIQAYLSRDALGEYRIPPVRQRPILLMGPPGVGKTQIMEQIAAETGVGLVSYTITHHTRQSALGLPFIEHHTYGGQTCAVTEYTMSEILATVYRLMEQTGLREGILFLDEVNCISETLAPMMLQFLQCKTFGNQRLPDGWIIVAAGNPPEYNKSVREFDVVTLDRVKRIDVEADYGVWKEYAYARGLHGAILSYLDLRRDHFYQIERTADGLAFVTARGWEDLSELMQAYEALSLPVDREVIGQYIQLPRIARDFANYLSLYGKYQQRYQIEAVLRGTWPPVLARELAAAPFDEKLSVSGLLLSRLRECARETWRADGLTDALYADLTRVKGALPGVSVQTALRAVLDDRQTELTRARQAGTADAERRRRLIAEIEILETYLHDLEQACPAAGEEAFALVREWFGRQTAARADSAQQTGSQMDAVFAFLEAALGESQELVLFATELTADPYTSWYIQNFGCDAYFRHNQALLFDDTRAALLDEIAAVRQQDAAPDQTDA